MDLMQVKGQKKLRCGYTTGSCAAAAAAAAATLLLTGRAPQSISLQTPRGVTLQIPVDRFGREGDAAVCYVRKDSGDDPDVTNGIRIYARVSACAQGIRITGGEGIGRVTKPGFACPVGAYAINPAPLAQIENAVLGVVKQTGFTGGIFIQICAENGEEIAQKTYSSVLGIEGGISILGTSGIVEPMSEKALIDTIRLEMDSCYAEGNRILVLVPGNYGEKYADSAYKIDIANAVKCSNFIGEALDYAVFKGFEAVFLIGHAGKLVKLAAGVMQTHSSVADGRQEIFAAHAALCGAERETVQRLMDSVTVDACVSILEEAGLRETVLESISRKIRQHIDRRVKGALQIEYSVFTMAHGTLFTSPDAQKLVGRIQEQKIDD